jgi:hypothetical protein
MSTTVWVLRPLLITALVAAQAGMFYAEPGPVTAGCLVFVFLIWVDGLVRDVTRTWERS